MRTSILASSVLALAVAAPAVHAHQAGDIIVRAGAVTAQTKEKSSSVKVDRGALAGTNLGGKATIGNDTQLGLNFAYMVTDNWAVELLAATPFKHDVAVKNTDLGSHKLGSLKHLPPTLSAVYYPLDNKSVFQPYVGAGVSYTVMFDESVKGSAKELGFSSLRGQNTWGWSAQVGADYMLTDKIMVNGQVRYIDIDTTAYVNYNGNRAKVDVDVKPWVYMLGLGYKF